MIHIRRSAIVPFPPMRMFDLVNDVEAYPRRFAWCAGAAVLAREPDAIRARLDVRIAGTTQSFSTRNTLAPPQRIGMQLVDGPFQSLSGAWEFTPLGDAGCKIALALDFEYRGRVLAPVFRAGFEKLADRMVDEFCREAGREHG
ncbi:MAG TPA: type II toxin-antitoxin system RatA family toxin [Rudaea sp.]|nr:type II toxin-antitoxin system RatA family toxin [Rudaea sp.]